MQQVSPFLYRRAQDDGYGRTGGAVPTALQDGGPTAGKTGVQEQAILTAVNMSKGRSGGINKPLLFFY